MNNGKWKRANQQYIETITESIRHGVPARHAARAAGITEKTYYEWLNVHSEFREAVEKAESEAVQINVAIIQKAAKRSWQASAWWLERTQRQDFALRQETALSGEVDVTHHNVKNPSALQSALTSLGFTRAADPGDSRRK